jgi:GTPase Era involved in 16S rRNA processing
MEIDTQQQPWREVRLCLVGKTGAGKSTLGNLLCPGANFKTSASAASVTSTAEQARAEYPERGLSLVLLDTMGLGDTAHRPEVVRQKITEGIITLVGGVDFFFLCIKKERFTEENYLIVTYGTFFIFAFSFILICFKIE